MTARTRTTSPPEEEVATALGLFLYAVVPRDRDLPEVAGIDGAPLFAVRHGPVAAVVSDLDLERPPGRRADLVAYSEVIDALASGGEVAPIRFGSALPDEAAVVDEVLAPASERLADLLASLRGRRQYNLRATYVEESVLTEVIQSDPEVRALRERTRDLPEEVAYGDRVRLGELVTRALEARAADDAEALMESLAPLVVADSVRGPASAQTVLDVALLVDDEQADAFEEHLEGLAEAVHERLRLRLLGPVAPYDFVGEL